MGLYDIDEEDKIYKNYICGKNHINIKHKPTEMINDYHYGIDQDNIISIFLNDKLFNELFIKLKNNSYKTYWLGFFILAFDNEDCYYGFEIYDIINEIKDEKKNRLNIYFIDEKENMTNKIELNVKEL